MPPYGGLLLSFKWLSARPSLQTGLVGEACILMGKLCVPLFCGNICIIYQANVRTFSFCHFWRTNGDLVDRGSDWLTHRHHSSYLPWDVQTVIYDCVKPVKDVWILYLSLVVMDVILHYHYGQTVACSEVLLCFIPCAW